MTTYYLDMDKMNYNGIICYSITKYENDEITASLLLNRYLVQEDEQIYDIAEYIYDEYFRRNKIKVTKDTRLMYRYGNQTNYSDLDEVLKSVYGVGF